MITVLGAGGFIGSHLLKELRESQIEYYAPPRDESLDRRELGDIIYCIGLTADFRSRPLDTVEAHVGKVLDILRNGHFDSLLYLSSTRVYNPTLEEAIEESDLVVNSFNPSDLYNISKLMGEAMAAASQRRTRVVRLSNVYGVDMPPDNFLPSIIRDAITKQHIRLETSLESAKDYMSIHDVVDALINIALKGQQRLYNVASGKNISNGQLAGKLVELTGCSVEVAPQVPTIAFPTINIERLTAEFDFVPANLIDDLEGLVNAYRQNESS